LRTQDRRKLVDGAESRGPTFDSLSIRSEIFMFTDRWTLWNFDFTDFISLAKVKGVSIDATESYMSESLFEFILELIN
jgi:hypothetical protein